MFNKLVFSKQTILPNQNIISIHIFNRNENTYKHNFKTISNSTINKIYDLKTNNTINYQFIQYFFQNMLLIIIIKVIITTIIIIIFQKTLHLYILVQTRLIQIFIFFNCQRLIVEKKSQRFPYGFYHDNSTEFVLLYVFHTDFTIHSIYIYKILQYQNKNYKICPQSLQKNTSTRILQRKNKQIFSKINKKKSPHTSLQYTNHQTSYSQHLIAMTKFNTKIQQYQQNKKKEYIIKYATIQIRSNLYEKKYQQFNLFFQRKYLPMYLQSIFVKLNLQINKYYSKRVSQLPRIKDCNPKDDDDDNGDDQYDDDDIYIPVFTVGQCWYGIFGVDIVYCIYDI
eukprot:TRINITY_DN14181_c0_g2_i2.p1 TRINITY_DN14181_c0_g2~~TRINITY_DN14181_c0_g2_i2.p1  ORF type:complete len:339 (+),score=-24.22 TRINITY_DN14181_c0_g2_i2:273-1289(+)